MLVAQESEAKESFGQLEMLQRTHDKLRSRADQLEVVHDALFSKLEVIKKTLMVSSCRSFCVPCFGIGWRRKPTLCITAVCGKSVPVHAILRMNECGSIE